MPGHAPGEKGLVVVGITWWLLEAQAWSLTQQTAWLCFKALSLLEETHPADILNKFQQTGCDPSAQQPPVRCSKANLRVNPRHVLE